MKRTITILLLALVVFSLVACNSTEVAELQEKLASAESRIEYLEQQEIQRRENDQAIYLRDTHDFVARGIVGLGEQYEVYDSYEVSDQQGIMHTKYVYKLNGATGLVDKSTGEWVPIDAVVRSL